ncbi:MAG: extracellular solute-binding protein [Christensenellaceae bacterium]|jgi:spermidine/putrescine transport system substrate-binding protein|nr:extracellular solute-binding protein [Christensenellaceae bacterium]
MKTKKLLSGIALGAVALTASAVSLFAPFKNLGANKVDAVAATNPNKLIIYNVEDYMALGQEDEYADMVALFEAANPGITVEYSTWDTNETMYNAIKNGGKFDLVIPSDYMVGKMVQENLAHPITWSELTNAGTAKSNLNPKVLEYMEAYDENNAHSVPYMYGTMGIMYNPTLDENLKADIEEQGWAVLWNEKYKGKITMKDAPRDSVAIAMLYANRGALLNAAKLDDSDQTNDYDAEYQALLSKVLNAEDAFSLDIARAVLMDQIEVTAPDYETDAGKNDLITGAGKKYMGLYWSCDAGIAMADNSDLEYYVPTEGSNVWIDNFVIPDCPNYNENIDAAHKFINFMLDVDNAAANMDYVGCESAVTAAVDLMKTEDWWGDVEDYDSEEQMQMYLDTVFTPSEVLEYCAPMKTFDADKTAEVSDLWESVKRAAANNLLWLWIVLGVVGAAGIGTGAYFLFIRKRR